VLHRRGDRVVRVSLQTSRTSLLHVTAPSGRPRSELDGVVGRQGWSFAIGALLVLAPGVVGGGYAPGTWASLTLVFAAIAGLGLLRPRAARPSRSGYAELALLAGLAVPAALEALEARLHLRPTLVAPALVLVGGLSLRWIFVLAGQL